MSCQRRVLVLPVVVVLLVADQSQGLVVVVGVCALQAELCSL